MKLFIVLLIVVLSGCSSYRVFTHDNMDRHYHYVVVKRNWFTGNETVYDCYSRPDTSWEPEGREVKLYRYTP